MDVHIGSKDGPPPSLADVSARFDSELQSKQEQWLDRLAADPARFAEFEQEIHDTFGKLADHAIAAILAEASQRLEMQTHKKKSWIRRLSRFVGRRNDR